LEYTATWMEIPNEDEHMSDDNEYYAVSGE